MVYQIIKQYYYLVEGLKLSSGHLDILKLGFKYENSDIFFFRKLIFFSSLQPPATPLCPLFLIIIFDIVI